MQSLAETVSQKIRLAQNSYHRLVLVVDGQTTENANKWKEVGEQNGAPVVNVNLELSRHLLNLSRKQRPLHVQRLLEQIVAELGSDIVLLYPTELLFDVSLQQDPLRLLQNLSRGRTVIAVWNGSIEDGCIRYAYPGHCEYQEHPLDNMFCISTG